MFVFIALLLYLRFGALLHSPALLSSLHFDEFLYSGSANWWYVLSLMWDPVPFLGQGEG